MDEWQENSIVKDIADLIESTKKHKRNSWAIRDGLHTCFCMLYMLEYLSSSEFKELSQLANEWAIKWSK